MVFLFFCCIEQPLSRAPNLPLFTIFAGQLTSHKSITGKTQEEKGNDEHEDRPGKLLYQEKYAGKNGDKKHQKIRDNIFPGDCHPVELLRVALLKKQGAHTAFSESTGFAIIVTVHAMPAPQPEFNEKNKKYIPDHPEQAEPGEDPCTNSIDQERDQAGYNDNYGRILLIAFLLSHR
jgi:hypothetical protein